MYVTIGKFNSVLPVPTFKFPQKITCLTGYLPGLLNNLEDLVPGNAPKKTLFWLLYLVKTRETK